MKTVILRASAKLNLSLSVVGRRADGYHLLDMLNCTLDLSDTLRLSPSGSAESTVSLSPAGSVALEPDALRPERNLVTRAIRWAQEHWGRPAATLVEIEKHIPVGGGMGGGSSDAGALLRWLWHKDACPHCQVALDSLAAELGADIPYFLSGGLARVQGVGERVTPLRSFGPPVPVLLVLPAAGVPTPRVYESLRVLLPTVETPVMSATERLLQAAQTGEGISIASIVSQLSAVKVNDLEPVVHSLQPDLARLHLALEDRWAVTVHMTGSGSTLFVFGDVPTLQSFQAQGHSLLQKYGATSRLAALEPLSYKDACI